MNKLTLTKRYSFDIKEFIVNNIEFYNKISRYPMLDRKLYTSDDSLFDEPKYNEAIEYLLSFRENQKEEVHKTRINSRKLSLRVRKQAVLEMLKKVSVKKRTSDSKKRKHIRRQNHHLRSSKKNKATNGKSVRARYFLQY